MELKHAERAFEREPTTANLSILSNAMHRYARTFVEEKIKELNAKFRVGE